MSSKHQVTIPQEITTAFRLGKGDFLEVFRDGSRIVIVPKEAVFEDKYAQEDLEAAEAALEKGMGREEIHFPSSETMVKYLKKKVRK